MATDFSHSWLHLYKKEKNQNKTKQKKKGNNRNVLVQSKYNSHDQFALQSFSYQLSKTAVYEMLYTYLGKGPAGGALNIPTASTTEDTPSPQKKKRGGVLGMILNYF